VHERVGVFYALQVSEGTQILQVKSFKSVDMIRGHSTPVLPSQTNRYDRPLPTMGQKSWDPPVSS
jgi:hypothetical protein